MGRRTAWIAGLQLLLPTPAFAQASITAILPADARLAVQRLGAAHAEAGSVGMPELLPGDFIITPDSAFVELRCPSDGSTTYRLHGPFRFVIDVPREAGCHLDLLHGEAAVIADEPTEQTVGAVTLGSKGTQYGIVATRDADGPQSRVIVFDGVVDMGTPSGSLRVDPGLAARYDTRADKPSVARSTSTQVRRWAGLYATFDVGKAAALGRLQDDSARVRERMTELHYEVLSHPADTARRVALAKEQIRRGILDAAAFNLRRVGVTTESELRRHDIDPAMLSRIRGIGRERN
jgi:hypothetical protein